MQKTNNDSLDFNFSISSRIYVGPYNLHLYIIHSLKFPVTENVNSPHMDSQNNKISLIRLKIITV